MATLTIRLHRKLVSTLLELSTVVLITQVVLDTDSPLPQLQRVKAYLRLYHQEIVALETSDDWTFQAKNNLLETHGLATTLEDLEVALPQVSDIEDLFTITVTVEELGGENLTVKIPKNLMMLAVTARGEFNPFVNSIFILQMQRAGVRCRVFPSANAYARIGLRLYNELGNHLLTESRYDEYLNDFVWGTDDRVFERLDELAQDLWHLRMAVHPSKSRVERLLVGLLGHNHQTVRDRAIMSLCSYYDSTDWELGEPFVPVITTVGKEFIVYQVVDTDVKQSDILFLLHSPVAQRSSPRYVLSYHKPEIHKSDKGTLLKMDLGSFLKCGFYDWRFAMIKDGSLEPLYSMIKNTEMSLTENQELSIVQGRFIVHPSNIRDLQIHEIFIDFQDAEFDMTTNEYTKRGSFSTVRNSLKERFKSGINCLYLMGALERDNGLSLENPKASPFAVTCRQSPCTLLGGEKEFKALLGEARNVGTKILVDCLARVSSTHYHRRYKNEEFYVINEAGKQVVCYGTDGRAISYDDTVLLNYRKASVWNLLVDDALEFAKKYRVDGVHLDNAHAWPQILVRNDTEMFRKDSDSGYHFSTQEIFDGLVVQRNEFFGYWASTARKSYANPLFFKLCKELWKAFPEFIIIADVWSGSGLEDRVPSIPRSGPIPRMYQLPVKLASIFGKRLHKNGQIEPIEKRDVSILKTWYEERKKTLPEGTIIVQSSSGNSLPYPALLYGRGAWAAADVLLLMPDIPMTFIGEQDGHVYRTPITHVYTQQANQDAAIDLKTGSSANLQEEDGRSSMNIPHVESAASLSVLSNIKDVVRKQDEYIRQIGPEFGFDLTRIKAHYHHRRSLRHEKAVLRYGELVPLVVRHEHGWHKQVLAFARHMKEETALVVINFTDHDIKGFLDLKNLTPHLSTENSIYSLGVWSDPETDQFWFREELLQGVHQVELYPYASQIYGLYPADADGLTTLSTSVDRLRKMLEANKPTDTAFLSLRIIEALQLADAAKALPIVANNLGLVGLHLVLGFDVPILKYVTSLSKVMNDPVLAARLMACLTYISQSHGPLNQVKQLSSEFLSINKLGPIVFTCPELGRWSTVGGLGVMVDELSQGLAILGEEVWVVSPYYERNKKGETGYLERDPAGIRWIRNVEIQLGNERIPLGMHLGKVNGVNVVFLHHALYFPVCYMDGKGSTIMRQLSVWGKATLESLCALGLHPSLIITNDWFTGLVPAYAKTGAFGDYFSKTTFLHIVHNLDPSYEGRMYPERNEGMYEGIHTLPNHYFVDPFWTQKVVNPSRCAILASDQWATVSPSYSKELMQASPLKELLKQKFQPFAFPNGIPIKQRLDRLRDKGTHETAKAALQKKYLSGNEDQSIPLFGFVGRITEQKGVHLILDAAEALIPATNYRVQFIVGGMASVGDQYSMVCAVRMKKLRGMYPRNFYADPESFFTDGPSVNLGCDYGLMPSLFEPGGIVQHEFFVAGTPVIAYRTGGLRDSVFEYNKSTQEGSGFVFERYRFDDFKQAIHRSIGVFNDARAYAILRSLAFKATMDVAVVSRAWSKEFYRLRSRLFHEPNEFLSYSRLLASCGWTSDHVDTTLQIQKSSTGLKRSASGALLAMADTLIKPEAGQSKRIVLFRYQPQTGPKARTVQLTGSFDQWQIRHPMHFDNTSGRWQVTLQLVKGRYDYKFIVDGTQWLNSPDMPMAADQHGNFNNVMDVN